jgi:hypothetical protein
MGCGTLQRSAYGFPIISSKIVCKTFCPRGVYSKPVEECTVSDCSGIPTEKEKAKTVPTNGVFWLIYIQVFTLIYNDKNR